MTLFPFEVSVKKDERESKQVDDWIIRSLVKQGTLQSQCVDLIASTRMLSTRYIQIVE